MRRMYIYVIASFNKNILVKWKYILIEVFFSSLQFHNDFTVV